jgi:ent-kaurenoic acid hydroxylase
MDGLMQIEDDEGSQYLSDQEVLDNIGGLVIAGYESTYVRCFNVGYLLSCQVS